MLDYTQVAFHNKISKLAIDYLNSLPKTGKPNANEWTVLSVVIQLNQGNENYKVVALGTGSKCIGKSQLSPNGDILNDSHAEVICRRAFIRYLHNQILLKAQNNEDSIFDVDKQLKQLVLKNVTFHLFTSHVPCGDATIFPKIRKRKMSANSDDVNDEKKVKIEFDNEDIGDIYRTGAKCLVEDKGKQDSKEKGESYHVLGAVRTKPGRGDPTLSMSCSDKMSRWCHLGVQGSLLTLILKEPIFFTTCTFAQNAVFNEESFNRAIYSRIQNYSKEIRGNIPLIVKQSEEHFNFVKTAIREQPCPSSISWSNVTHRSLEVAVDGRKQGVTKKKLLTKAGRLQICKRELFHSFLILIKELSVADLCNYTYENLMKLSLNEAKSLCEDYQKKWANLKKHGYKVWAQKDKNLTDFKIDELI